MRVLSGVCYILACIAGLSTIFFPFFYFQSGATSKNVFIYADFFGKLFLACCVVGIICALIGLHKICFPAGLISMGCWIAKYITIVIKADEAEYIGGEMAGSTYSAFNGLIDGMDAYTGSFTVVMGSAYPIMLGAAIGMIAFGFFYWMTAKPSNY